MYDVTMWQEYFEYFQHVWYLIHNIILNSRMMSQGGKNGRKGPLNVRSSSVTRRPTVSDDIFSSSVSRIVRWNTCREWYLSYCYMLLFFFLLKIMTILPLIISSDWGLIELTSLLTWASDGGTQEDRLNFQNQETLAKLIFCATLIDGNFTIGRLKISIHKLWT